MGTKTIISIIGLLLIVGLAGQLLNYFGITTFDTKFAIGIGRIAGVVLMLQLGSFIQTKFLFRLLIFFVVITTIGSLIKIMHWPYANTLLRVGLIGIPTVYFIHFIKKKSKNHLDYLKFLWVILFFTTAVFIIEHFPYKWELRNSEGLLFLILFADFAYQYFKVDKSIETKDETHSS